MFNETNIRTFDFTKGEVGVQITLKDGKLDNAMMHKGKPGSKSYIHFSDISKMKDLSDLIVEALNKVDKINRE